MSVVPFLLERPVYSFINQLDFPVVENIEGEDVTVALIDILIPLNFLLDNFAEDVLARGRSLGEEQSAVYNNLAGRLAGQFGLDGKTCLLRFICELQRRPIGRWTMAGHLLTLLFTPHARSVNDVELLRDFTSARNLGQMKEDTCSSHYYSCPISVFNYFDTLANTTSSAISVR